MNRLSPERLVAASTAVVAHARQQRDLPHDPLRGAIESRGAALIHECGYWSHYDHASGASSWPVPKFDDVAELARFADDAQVLQERPRVGDLFVQYSPIGASFVRAGIVAMVADEGQSFGHKRCYDILSIEGGTNENGELGGGYALALARRLVPACGDRFIRWTDIGPMPSSLIRAPATHRTPGRLTRVMR
jgi:hypothetical protein